MISAILLTFLAAQVAAAPAAPSPSPIQTFGNWAVACDNGLQCTAVSLQPQESAYKGIGLVVERDAGPDGRTQVHVSHINDAHRGPAEIAVDGRTVASGVLDAKENMRVLIPAES